MNKDSEKIKSAVADFQSAIEKIGEKSDKLSVKLLWLNIVLTIATAVGAIATVILALDK